MEKRTNSWMVAFLVLLFSVLAFGIGVFSYFMGKNKGSSSVTTPTAFPTQASLSTPTPLVNETTAISEVVYKKFETDSTKMVVTISKQEGNYAKGSIKEIDAVGGAYFLAAKVEGNWIVVYDGQANPTCAQIAPYNFPTDFIPECLDSAGKVIKR